MLEYGRTTGETTSGVGGGGGGGGSIDFGGGVMEFVNSAVEQVSAMPPEQLLILGVLALIGLAILRR